MGEMIRTVLLVLTCALALGGCASVAPKQLAEYDAADDQMCKSQGFDVNSPAYSNCRFNVSDARYRGKQANREAWGAALSSVGRNLRREPNPTNERVCISEPDILGKIKTTCKDKM